MHYLIIGNCIAGINAAETVRKLDGKNRITVVSDEAYPAYGRCLISYYLAGTRREEDLWLKEKDFYQKNNIELLLNQKVTQIRPDNNCVVLSGGKELKYDRLLIATGASASPLGIEGENKAGVFCFRTLDDAKKIMNLSPRVKKALVFGGGLIGLKVGYALKQRGIAVEVIVKSSRILSQVIDGDSAQTVTNWLTENGIKIRTGLGPESILGNKEVDGVLLDNGEKMDCQIVIVGKGVTSNVGLVKDTKIQTHWGIVTDKYLRTNAENVYAAGDVAETKDMLTGEYVTSARWTSAAEQGRVAGTNMAGEKKEYPGSVPANSVEFFGLPVISLGHVRVKADKCEILIRSKSQYQSKKIFLQGNRLLGAVLVGGIENAGVYLALIRKKADISSVKEMLLEDWFDYAKVSDLLEQIDGFRESVSLKGDLIKMA